MYRLRHFKEIYGNGNIGNAASSSFTEYSIYGNYPFSLERLINNVVRLITPCETIYIHWLYWYVLLLSVLKLLNSICELIGVFGQANKLFISRNRQLLHVSHKWQKRVRQFVICLVCIMDLTLLLGMLMMKPHFMTPWINVQLFSLVNDILIYIYDICCGTIKPSCRDLVLFLLIYLNLEFVWCTKKIFVHALSTNKTNGYSLF